jgi:hypothetical protein
MTQKKANMDLKWIISKIVLVTISYVNRKNQRGLKEMKKTILLLLFLLLITNFAWSWVNILDEDFEYCWLPVDWDTYELEGNPWVRSSSEVHSDNYSACYSDTDIDYTNNAWLITYEISYSLSCKAVQLVFWENVENPFLDVDLKVLITDDDDDPEVAEWAQLYLSSQDTGWNQRIIDINIDEYYPSSGFWIAFQYGNDTSSMNPKWYIDDVQVRVLPKTAPGLPYNPDPADDETGISACGNLTWIFGQDTDTYDLYFGDKGNIQFISSNPATTSSFQYSDLNSESEYEWQIVAHNHDNLTTEGPVWNFTTEAGAICSFPYTEGFEDWSGSPLIPDGWTVLDLNAGNKWSKASPSHSGSFKAYSRGGDDDWLISPQFGLYGATGYNLTWWDRSSYINDYEVLVSIETNDHADFLEVALGTYHCTSTNWTQHTIDLSDYCEDDIFLAFHQTNEGNSDYALSIDDFLIEEIPPTNPIFSINPESKDFGDGYTDQTSFAQTFTITNEGVGTLTITSVAIGGTDSNHFTLTDLNSYPNDLGEGESINVDAAFSPTSIGDKTATLSVEFSTRVSHSASLSGTGIEPNYCTGSAGTGNYSFANNLATGAPSVPSYNWLDISSTGTDVFGDLSSDDGFAGGAEGYNIGFTFNFFGVDYTKFWIAADGFISLGTGHEDYSNQNIPRTITPNGLIALFWDDLNPTTPVVDNAAIYYQLFGNYLVITYENLEPYTSPSATKWFTAQAILYQNSNIKLQYKDKGADMPIDGCTIGIENGDGTCAVNYHFNDAGGLIYPDDKEGEIAVMFGEDEGSLPVVLSSFTAEFSNNMPTLYWITESEIDNLGWYLYRNIEEIFTNAEVVSEFIEGYGTTTEQHSYFFEDPIENLLEGTTYYYWLESIDLGGVPSHYNQIASLTIPDNVQPELPENPISIGLYQNYPNPFNPSFATTNISFYLDEGTNAHVKIEIYNIKGELVKTIWNQYTVFEKSTISAFWDGCDEKGKRQATGIYFYRMQANGKNKEIKKLILLN